MSPFLSRTVHDCVACLPGAKILQVGICIEHQRCGNKPAQGRAERYSAQRRPGFGWPRPPSPERAQPLCRPFRAWEMAMRATQGGAARRTAPLRSALLCPGLICCSPVGANSRCNFESRGGSCSRAGASGSHIPEFDENCPSFAFASRTRMLVSRRNAINRIAPHWSRRHRGEKLPTVALHRATRAPTRRAAQAARWQANAPAEL